MKKIKYWIIACGEYDSCWESVVIANSAQDALKRFRRYRIATYKSDIKRLLKANPGVTVYQRTTENVTVQKAKISKQGVICFDPADDEAVVGIV